jgi:LAO/AO transport system kinase
MGCRCSPRRSALTSSASEVSRPKPNAIATDSAAASTVAPATDVATAQRWRDELRSGGFAAMGRLLRRIDDADSEALAVAELLAAHTPRCVRLGITGAPGVGKSTLTTAMVRLQLANGARVAVLAVDPSSPRTGGALLGDRLRFGDLSDAPGLFLRSLATRGASGGLSRAVEGSLAVLDAAGFDFVWVETVGVGQAEVEVAHCVDAVAVITAPGLGDDVQAMKAGLVEVADVLVVNKGDRPEAARAHAELEAMQRLRQDGRSAVILTTSATTHTGIDALLAALIAAANARREHGNKDGVRERISAKSRVVHAASELARTLASDFLDGEGHDLLDDVVSGRKSAQHAARAVLEAVTAKLQRPEIGPPGR